MSGMIRAGALQALRAARPLFARPAEAIVLPPADSGSAGDQAMLDATAEQLAGPLGRRVVVSHVYALARPIALRVDHAALDGVAPGGVAALRRLLAANRAGAALALGADVIDGVYGPSRELRKLRFLAAAAAAGAQVAVLGCSISKTPAPAVVAALRGSPGLRVFLRDEISLERFEALTGRPGELVADTAFLLRPEITLDTGRAAAAFVAGQRAAGRTVLAVNASGHTLAKAPAGAADALAVALRGWLDGRGWSSRTTSDRRRPAIWRPPRCCAPPWARSLRSGSTCSRRPSRPGTSRR